MILSSFPVSARLLIVLPLSILAFGCNGPEKAPTAESSPASTREETMGDVHSYSRPDEIAVEHLDLDLTVDFAAHRLEGRASWRLDRRSDAAQVVLDTKDLEILSVTLDDGIETQWTLGDDTPWLGSRLAIDVTPETRVVQVEYKSSPGATAVQWLSPGQTAGGELPFLFTQSQAILARTWVPCQDSPGVRFTYNATVTVPSNLIAVMSASNATERNADGVYHFEMPQAIPSYLLALAVGDLEFRSMSDRTGVWAEASVVEKAAWEFADTEDMMVAVENLYGPYRWGRYDILVLPPSFPFGGMENPRLTFATPTILAGDRSLVSLIAHELAHSWSGNLVTNATWDDFWLNEGFTVYLERRIMEEISGRDYSEMLALLGLQDLKASVADLPAADTHLKLDLNDRDPDEGMTDIAYEKGYFFLRLLEETVGRERFDEFLRQHFDGHAFQSMTTEQFVAELESNLLGDDAELTAKVDAQTWIYGPGLPANLPVVESQSFAQVDGEIAAWSGGRAAAALDTGEWTTHQWLHFLRGLPEELSGEQMADLDAAFGLSSSGNSEVLHAWLHHVIRNQYEPGYDALRRFLTGMGRRKFLKPLYERLAETPEGMAMAREIYASARAGYHSVSTSTIDEILNWKEGA